MKRHDDEVLAGVLRRLIENNRDDHGCAYIDTGATEDFFIEGREPLSVVERRLIAPLCEPPEDDERAQERETRAERREVDRVARVLMAAWEQAEGTPVSPSYVATFADLARAVIADVPPPTGVALRVGLGE
jgi:hypothetical protein